MIVSLIWDLKKGWLGEEMETFTGNKFQSFEVLPDVEEPRCDVIIK